MKPWNHYVEHTVSVDRETQDVSPYGVLHMLGNVRELTETIWIATEGSRKSEVDWRIVKGSWIADPLRELWRQKHVRVFMHAAEHGFRCAKSASH